MDPARQTRIDFVSYGSRPATVGSRLVGETGAPAVAVSVARLLDGRYALLAESAPLAVH